jgi:hypothetical protein
VVSNWGKWNLEGVEGKKEAKDMEKFKAMKERMSPSA